MGTNPSQDARQGKSLHNELNRFLVFSLPDKLHISMDVDTCRTGGHTGGTIFFLYVIGNWNRLWKTAADRFSFSQVCVPTIRYRHGTDFFALAATGANTLFYKAGISTDLHRVITDKSGYFRHFTVGQKFNIRILCHFYHFRGSDTGSTIECGEGLVELKHMPADGGVFFYQVYFMTRIANIQGSLHPGNAASHHHDIRMNGNLAGFEALMVVYPINGSSNQAFGLVGGLIPVGSYP